MLFVQIKELVIKWLTDLSPFITRLYNLVKPGLIRSLVHDFVVGEKSFDHITLYLMHNEKAGLVTKLSDNNRFF